MYFMFVDESGATSVGDDREYLCLVGVIIHEDNIRNLDSKLNAIKKYYLGKNNVELKSNEIRRQENIYRDLSAETFQEFQNEIASFIGDFDFKVLAAIINTKKLIIKKSKSKLDPYEKAYELILKKYNEFLKNKKSNGIVIMDSKTGKLGFISRKGDSDSKMRYLHMKLQYMSTKTSNRLTKIIGGIFFVDSKYINGVQLADLCCYPFYFSYKYQKTRYKPYKLIMQKVYRGENNTDISQGVSLFPENFA